MGIASKDFAVSQGLEAGVWYKAQIAIRSNDVWSEYSAWSDSCVLQRKKRDRENMDTSNSDLCSICLDSHAEVAFDPCGHYCACSSCGALCRACPICRQPVAKRL